MTHDKVSRHYQRLLFAIALAGISSLHRIEDKTMYYVVFSGLCAILILLNVLILKRRRKLREEAEV